MNEAVLYAKGLHYASYEATFVFVAVLSPSQKTTTTVVSGRCHVLQCGLT